MLKYGLFFSLLVLLFACDSGTKGNEEEAQTETTETPEPEVVNPFADTKVVEKSVEEDNDFYMTVNIGGVEKTFDQMPAGKCAQCNHYKIQPNGETVLRVMRYYDEEATESFTLQLHNINLHEPDSLPVVFEANTKVKPQKLTRVLYNKVGENGKKAYEAKNGLITTVTKIEGDIYTGTFEGTLAGKDGGAIGEEFVINGKFRIQFKVQDRREQPAS
ncbi:MAG: hypothetical protein AAF740_00730 [Bacteroidota bacterium]